MIEQANKTEVANERRQKASRTTKRAMNKHEKESVTGGRSKTNTHTHTYTYIHTYTHTVNPNA